jgi:hypothetical protein
VPTEIVIRSDLPADHAEGRVLLRRPFGGRHRRRLRQDGFVGRAARRRRGSSYRIFHDFGEERITKGGHLEKLCLIKEGVGRDNISDFTTNLIGASSLNTLKTSLKDT